MTPAYWTNILDAFLSANVPLPIVVIAALILLLRDRLQVWKLKSLEAMAMVDSLTGLYTRRFMNARLLSLESEARRFIHTDVFVLFIDIDHFKKVNDVHGHDIGDRVLTGVTEIVHGKLRVSDMAGRWGGEEIVVLGRGSGEVVAERIRRTIEDTSIMGVIHVTVSIGLATFNPDGTETLTATVARADKAMYIAKNTGRNRVVTEAAVILTS